MKVLVLGGAGAVCSETSRVLAKFSDFEEIVVADYDLDSANGLVKEIGDPRLSTVKFDANKYEEMVKLFPGHDVVISGLPCEYDRAVTRACAETGVNGLRGYPCFSRPCWGADKHIIIFNQSNGLYLKGVWFERLRFRNSDFMKYRSDLAVYHKLFGYLSK